MKKRFYFFLLEIVLKQENDTTIYAHENISHVLASKLIENFDIDLERDPHILDGYFLTEENYLKHIEYITKNIITINLEILNIDYKGRINLVRDFSKSKEMAQNIASEQKIKYVYVIKNSLFTVDSGRIGAERIFENEEVEIYKY